MKKIILISGILTGLLNYGGAREIKKDFLSAQKEYPRVRKAFADKGGAADKVLEAEKIDKNSLNILIAAYKAEAKLELYAKSKSAASYKKIAVYDIKSSSGRLGPKRKRGDLQVPEGFYHIDRFNPSSKFYLSLGINYPNASDKKKSAASDLGGDIFIHGSDVTIGCIPVSDDKIKEIYVYAVYAKNSGQSKIPVYIFPFEMTDKNAGIYGKRYGGSPGLLSFWENLKTGYDKFAENAQELKISTDNNGDYLF
jgi:murein L,D-transpeptidase YafK